jgi:hypothetical protein
MIHPKARRDEVVVQEVFDELVVYDLERNQVHSLNPTAALVWQQCDGRTSPAELAGRLSPELEPAQANALVWLALDRLEKAHLLEQKVDRPDGQKISRRRALRTLGISALLPVVASLLAPTAVQAQTCAGSRETFGPLGGTCGQDLNSLCAASCIALNPDDYNGGTVISCDDTSGSIDKIECCCIS